MSSIRQYLFRMMLGLLVLGLASLIPLQAGAGTYMTAKRPIPEPTGAGQLCTRYAWACMVSHRVSAFDDDDLRLVRRVNTRINRQTRQVTDQRQYARPEVWALPTRLGGDCEDFALLKKRELMRAGIPADRLLIATVLDRRMRGHAVLVVRSHRGDVVLDNLSSRVLPWEKTGYIFMKMQNPRRAGSWDAILAGGSLLRGTPS